MVYNEIQERLLEFRETLMERQARVEQEFDSLARGGKSALECLPHFEKAVSEMQPAGVCPNAAAPS